MKHASFHIIPLKRNESLLFQLLKENDLFLYDQYKGEEEDDLKNQRSEYHWNIL